MSELEGYATMDMAMDIKVSAVVMRYHRKLLENSKAAINRGENQLAVILAQIACEVCTELVFDTLLQRKGATALEDLLFQGATTFNLASPRVYNHYAALSGPDIRQKRFWQPYKEHVKRRNAIAHRGVGASQADAEASCRAAGDLIGHLEAIFPEVAP